MTYSAFMAGLKKAQIEIDRKVLADLAVTRQARRSRKLAGQVKASLAHCSCRVLDGLARAAERFHRRDARHDSLSKRSPVRGRHARRARERQGALSRQGRRVTELLKALARCRRTSRRRAGAAINAAKERDRGRARRAPRRARRRAARRRGSPRRRSTSRCPAAAAAAAASTR